MLNVLIVGPTDVCKTWIACALARQSCRQLTILYVCRKNWEAGPTMKWSADMLICLSSIWRNTRKVFRNSDWLAHIEHSRKMSKKKAVQL